VKENPVQADSVEYTLAQKSLHDNVQYMAVLAQVGEIVNLQS